MDAPNVVNGIVIIRLPDGNFVRYGARDDQVEDVELASLLLKQEVEVPNYKNPLFWVERRNELM